MQDQYKDLQDFVVEVSALYNKVVFSPVNLKEEKERILQNKDTRADWKYEVPDLSEYYLKIKQFNKLKKLKKNKGSNFFDKNIDKVVVASLKLVKSKLEILKRIKEGKFKSNDKVREDIFGIKTNLKYIDKAFKEVCKNKELLKISEQLKIKDLTPEDTKKIMEELLDDARKKIEKVFDLPKKYKKEILQKAVVKVKIVDDHSFLFKCITDPKTLEIQVLISKHTNYSKVLVNFGVLHEFGHAIDSIMFDQVFIPKKLCSSLYSFAGVSTPNIFDIKAEVFADLVASIFLGGGYGKKMLDFRKKLWLVARSRADYAYHFEKKSIFECMKYFEDVGLGEYAFEEMMAITFFISGQRGVFAYAHKFFEDFQKKNNLPMKQYLSLLLYSGKIPFYDISKLKRDFAKLNFE